MGDGELVDAHPVMAHEQPAAQPLLVGVEPVAGGGLGDLAEECLLVLVDDGGERPTATQLVQEGTGIEAQRVARDLRDGAHVERTAQHQGHADDALVTHGGDLDDGTVVEGRDQRDDPVHGEVDGTDRLARLEEHGLDVERHRDHAGRDALAV